MLKVCKGDLAAVTREITILLFQVFQKLKMRNCLEYAYI